MNSDPNPLFNFVMKVHNVLDNFVCHFSRLLSNRFLLFKLTPVSTLLNHGVPFAKFKLGLRFLGTLILFSSAPINLETQNNR